MKHCSNFRASLLLLCLLGAAAPTYAQPQDQQTLSEKIDAYIAPYVETGNFNGVILVGQGDQIIHNRGYGQANRDFDIPNTPETRFPLGTIGDQLTATAVLQLADEGRIRLNDKLKKYVREYRFGDRMTIHQVLMHTGGVPDFASGSPYRGGINGQLPDPREQRFEALNRTKPLFKAGSNYSYSSTGYWLLQELIAEVSGESAPTYIRRNILQPAGMTHTVWDLGQIIEDRATGHYWSHRGLIKDYYFRSPSPGTWYAPADDVWRLMSRLDSASLLSETSRNAMFTKHDGLAGYSFFVNDGSQGKMVWQVGNLVGFQANVFSILDRDLTIVIFSNIFNSPIQQILSDVLNLSVGNNVQPYRPHSIAEDVDQSHFSDLAGTYRSGTSNRLVRITEAREGLYLDLITLAEVAENSQVQRMVLLPAAKDHFFLMDMAADVYFPSLEQIESLIFIEGNTSTEMKRFDASSLNLPDVQSTIDR